MDRRQDGTAAAFFAERPVPVPGESIAPHQDARLTDERRAGTPPIARRRRPICGPGQRPVRRRATRDPRAAVFPARPTLPHPGLPSKAAAAGPATQPRRS